MIPEKWLGFRIRKGATGSASQCGMDNKRLQALKARRSNPGLAARGESAEGCVPSAAWADARRRDAGDAVTSSRSANAADAHAPPEPFGIWVRSPMRAALCAFTTGCQDAKEKKPCKGVTQADCAALTGLPAHTLIYPDI